MSKIVDMNGTPVKEVAAGEPVPDVVESLEEMLEMARSGELICFAFTGILRDKSTTTSYSCNPLLASPTFLMGSISRMLHRIIARYEEE